MRINLKKEEWLLALIIVAGAVLRFYNFWELPLTFDEFSALSRTHFDNFKDLIHFGVVTSDTHPAGVQVFMYYWVKIFGDGAMIVKLPFMIAGLVSIYFAYRIAEQWFNPTVGLMVAMFLAFLQYPIYLTQMARPYASGLFLSVLLVWFWSGAFLHCRSGCYGYKAGFVIVAALCAYNHYFTLFFAGLVSASGFFVIKRKQWLGYSVSLLIAVILFLPHLKIFFIQLSKGGVESWLAKPEPDFFIRYIAFILHFNAFMYVLAGLLLLSSFVFSVKSLRKENRYRWLLFSWISITYLVAYFYSVYVNAVLQYSVLFFTYPFLIILLFSFFRNISFKYQVAMLLLFGVTSVVTLANGRQHYKIFYQSGQKEILKLAEKEIDSLGANDVTVAIDLPPNINRYYFDKLNIDPAPFRQIDDFGGYIPFRHFLSRQQSEYLLLGWYDEKQISYLSVALEQYPYMIQEKNWFLCDYYMLAKHVNADSVYKPADPVIYSYQKDFIDRAAIINGNQEYINLFRGTYRDIIDKKYNNLFLSVKASLNDMNRDVFLVTEFKQGDEIVNWRACSFLDFIDTPHVLQTVHEGVKLIDLGLDPDNTLINVYLWNKNKADFSLNSFTLTVRQGNPVLYSLYYDFDNKN